MEDRRIQLTDKQFATVTKAIEKMRGTERSKIVDAFMDHAPILNPEPEDDPLAKVEILQGEDGKVYYRCPHSGEIKSVPDEVGAAILRKLEEKRGEPC